MSEHKYTRRGKRIETVKRDDKGNPVWSKGFDSINQAKRKSRELQVDEDGALGLGSLRVA